MTKKLLLSALCLCVTALANDSYAVDAATCDNIWYQIKADPTLPTPAEKAEAMKLRGNECMDDEVFIAQLANLYMQMNNLDAAAALLYPALKNQPTSLVLAERIAHLAFRKGDDTTAHDLASEIVKQDPKFAEPYATLSMIEMRRNNWAGALEYSKKLHELSKKPRDLLLVAVELFKLNRHEEGVNAFYQALKEDPSLIGDDIGVDQAIYVIGALGRIDEAKELAKRHMAAAPDWQQDAIFVKVAKKLKIIE